ncbi:MAG TPA: hypothetical protein ENF98_01305 [Candidatus Bathyarchaeota archaeon]|nr:hypothetical protein [Candidatus Bathyarchaeota archaeon]
MEEPGLGENPLLRLPRPIVESLFRYASEEAERAKRRILKLVDSLKQLSESRQFRDSLTKIGDGIEGNVVVADGSMSTAPSVRLGSAFGVYTAGYMVFKGKSLVDEGYYAASLSWTEPLRAFKFLLKLAMAFAERKAALEAYYKHRNVDFIILDGPYFYFASLCRYIHGIRFDKPIEGFYNRSVIRTGEDLVKEIRDMTLELMETGKAVCIIRRSGGRAIDGWLLYNWGEEKCLGDRDKHILTMLMPPMAVWSYRKFLHGGSPFVYTRMYRLYMRRKYKGKPVDKGSVKGLIAAAKRTLRSIFEKDLLMDPSDIPRLERYYVRYSKTAPPFEVEVVEGTDVERFARLFVDFYNPATGLPFPLDLIDQAVSLPRGSTTAFTQEVEAHLIHDRDIEDKSAISDYFTYLNPQKEEYV